MNCNDSTNFHILFSHHLYCINQMAGIGVDSLSTLQVLGDYPKDGKNWLLEVDKTKEGIYDEGCVSC